MSINETKQAYQLQNNVYAANKLNITRKKEGDRAFLRIAG